MRQEGRIQAWVWAANRDLVTDFGSVVFRDLLGSFLVFFIKPSYLYSFKDWWKQVHLGDCSKDVGSDLGSVTSHVTLSKLMSSNIFFISRMGVLYLRTASWGGWKD